MSHRIATTTTGLRVAVAAIVLAVLVLALVGGYALGWRWTGLSPRVTLWDWLEALALPIALASMPLVLRQRHSLTRRHRSVIFTATAVFVTLALLGYLVPLAWTGFPGNTLWDWLQLMLLPAAVTATTALWEGRPRLQRRQGVAAATVVLAFVLLVLVGYAVPLRWTGFAGNTLWDWIKLLLLPVLVPTVLAPVASRHLSQRLQRAEST